LKTHFCKKQSIKKSTYVLPNPVFAQFLGKESIENHTYAKPTLAKTIGNNGTENIYVSQFLIKERCLVFGYSGATKPKKLE
jgi:hypothetical protein